MNNKKKPKKKNKEVLKGLLHPALPAGSSCFYTLVYVFEFKPKSGDPITQILTFKVGQVSQAFLNSYTEKHLKFPFVWIF